MVVDIVIDKSSLSKSKFDDRHLIQSIASGNAILFTGAGFSGLVKNVQLEELSAAESLAHSICDLGNFERDNDLRYAADYFIANNNKSELVSLLQDKYTVHSTDEIHDVICSANWRRFYTTNYDKSIELASANVGKKVECIDISFPTKLYYRKDNLCIHLNGSIDSLNEETIESTFKLSTSSYISPESFIQSDWYYYFKKDLERCSAIIFVGYSMYDIEIQKILYENSTFREKTYFITRENPDPKTKFTLSKFGEVIPIGVEGFAKLIKENKTEIEGYDTEYHLKSLVLYQLSHEKIIIHDADVDSMMMFGHVIDGSVDEAVLGEQDVPYLIIRKHLERVKDFVNNGKNLVLYSDMGNGKSILLDEIHTYLTATSIDCYHISDLEGDFIDDIDYLSKTKKKIVITLDGYDRYLGLLEHYSLSLPDNINIIATSRTAEHERLRSVLAEMDFQYNEISIDNLYQEEVLELVDIIDNLGRWGDDMAGLPEDRKIKFIQNKNSSQLSLTLLNLFNSPQIKDRILTEIKPLISDSQVKDTIFAIALSEVVGIPCTFSMISEISGNDKIFDANLTRNNNFNNLFHIDVNGINAKSSLFCLSLIVNYFSPSYVTNELQKVAKKFNRYASRDSDQDKLFKSVLRFSFVERLLSDANKKANLKSYYEGLKISVSWLKDDPHFWLQYAMANITFKEYPNAQRYLKQSYSIAANRYDSRYDTSNIDTQQARLLILIAMEEVEKNKIYDGFYRAHLLLDKLDNDIYKFRQVAKYRDFYISCYAKLSKANQVNFEHACNKMIKSIDTAVKDRQIDLSQQVGIRKAKENLEFIKQSISSQRKENV